MPESEVGDELTIPLDVRLLQILEKAATPSDHLEKATTTVVVLPVYVEVGSEVVDASREDRDLDGSASTVFVVELVLLNDVFFDDRHVGAGLRESQSLQGKRCVGSMKV